MAKNLLIVESPAKAKTIEGFLGKDFTVKSSYGHIRDLPEKGLSVIIEENFKPIYEISPDKKKIIEELNKHVQKSDTIWLATDEDREGEAIAWHLFEVLNLSQKDTKRIVFNEITKKAIQKAIESPRAIDLHLVNAQQARRILDRLVGYEISPVLWKKVRPNLSAGRVQSVAVRLIVEREREREATAVESWFKVSGTFNNEGKKFKAAIEQKISDEKLATEILQKAASAIFHLENIEVKPIKRSPTPPFTTSTLQQEASRRLGMSVTRTMRLAQQLYEEGKITYMRSDSVHLSEDALHDTAIFIKETFGEKYHKKRQYITKAKGAQEAHEAIRPTQIEITEVEGESALRRLYQLIWQRTVASQMADAELEKTVVTISTPDFNQKFIAKGEILRFEGFLKLYQESSEDSEEFDEFEENQSLPPFKKGDLLSLAGAQARQKFSNLPSRYTEASLVRKLEDLGIGRPSTYAPTINTIQQRGYVEKKDIPGVARSYVVLEIENQTVTKKTFTEITGAEKAKLFPTDIGILVNDFLVKYFTKIMDFGFTAEVESQFDIIAEGQIDWVKVLNDFYGSFHETVISTEKTSEKVKGKRFLGQDPKTGENVYALLGRYGPIIQLGEANSNSPKPRFAPLKKDWRLETVTLNQALSLFELPKILGFYEESEVAVGTGRFGPYVRWGSKFFSLPKGADPYEIRLDDAINIIKNKLSPDLTKQNIIKDFDGSPYRILNGRYGPYITDGKSNFKIPKSFAEPSLLSLEDVMSILQEKTSKSKPGRNKKKK